MCDQRKRGREYGELSADEQRRTYGGGGLPGGLGGELLAGRLATGGLARCLLGAGHVFRVCERGMCF